MNAELLEAMAQEVGRASPLYRSSRFWENLGQKNEAMLSEHGLENFKRTVAQNYFNWLILDWRNNQFRNLLRLWRGNPSLAPLLNRIEPLGLIRTTDGLERSITGKRVTQYKIFVGLLWEFARRVDLTGLAKSLQEPAAGNPIRIWRGKQLISQDLANSLREASTILRFEPGSSGAVFGELGAGYGRLGYVLLQNPAARYLVFDVPPTLAVAQWYLPRVFPEARVFRFRSFGSFREIEDELAQSRIAFFTPNQLEMFPDRYFDVFASISTLPEMNRSQVQNYLSLMGLKTKSAVYLKQWREWRNDLDDYLFTASDVQVPGMRKVFEEVDAVQDQFFEAVWRRTTS